MKRHTRVRGKVSGTPERPRLNVFRSGTNIYAQIIDDAKGVTLVSASSLEKGFEGAGNNCEAAAQGGRSHRPSVPRTRASTLWSLTAAVTCTTAV